MAITKFLDYTGLSKLVEKIKNTYSTKTELEDTKTEIDNTYLKKTQEGEDIQMSIVNNGSIGVPLFNFTSNKVPLFNFTSNNAPLFNFTSDTGVRMVGNDIWKVGQITLDNSMTLTPYNIFLRGITNQTHKISALSVNYLELTGGANGYGQIQIWDNVIFFNQPIRSHSDYNFEIDVTGNGTYKKRGYHTGTWHYTEDGIHLNTGDASYKNVLIADAGAKYDKLKTYTVGPRDTSFTTTYTAVAPLIQDSTDTSKWYVPTEYISGTLTLDGLLGGEDIGQNEHDVWATNGSIVDLEEYAHVNNNTITINGQNIILGTSDDTTGYRNVAPLDSDGKVPESYTYRELLPIIYVTDKCQTPVSTMPLCTITDVVWDACLVGFLGKGTDGQYYTTFEAKSEYCVSGSNTPRYDKIYYQEGNMYRFNGTELVAI